MTLLMTLLAGAVAFFASLALSRLFSDPRWPINMLDHPSERSLHELPRPRSGGLAVLAGLLVGHGIAVWLGLPALMDPTVWAGVALIAGVSLVDDIRNLSAAVRLSVHFAAAWLLTSTGYVVHELALPGGTVLPLGVLATPLTLLFIVWMANLYNFMDGMDGLAGGMTVFGFGGLAIISAIGSAPALAVTATLVAAAALGFLRFNFPPARIFLGDNGAVTLGFLAAALILAGMRQGAFPLWVPALGFSMFLVDATATLIRRTARGEKVWQAHRQHYFQRMVLAGWGHRRTCLTAYALMAGSVGSMVLLVVVGNALADVAALLAWCSLYLAICVQIDRMPAGVPLGRPRTRLVSRRQIATILHDAAWVPLAVLAAYALRHNFDSIPEQAIEGLVWTLAVAIPIFPGVFWSFELHQGTWRFVSMPNIMRIVRAVLIGSLICGILLFVLRRTEGVPRSVLVLLPILLVLALSAPRLIARRILEGRSSLEPKEQRRALIVGAGALAEAVVEHMQSPDQPIPVAAVDTDPRQAGREVCGVPVVGTLRDAASLLPSERIELIVLAKPEATPGEVTHLLAAAATAGVPCRTVPFSRVADGVRIDDFRLRPLTISDLLNRAPVVTNPQALAGHVRDEVVLVTGGAGAIGSELCRQIAALMPRTLVVCDHNEASLGRVKEALRIGFPDVPVETVLTDIVQPRAVDALFQRTRPGRVFHIAGLQNAHLLEDNPLPAIAGNVLGCRIVADAARRHASKSFVLASTPEAAQPAGIMAATKHLAERYCLKLNSAGQTRYITVRIGEVLGSPGSVVSQLQIEIAAGGPLTLEHPEQRRYMTTLPETASLLIQASAGATDGQTLVLDCGEPIVLRHLAEQMIRLEGYTPYEEIPIRYTGLAVGRPLLDAPPNQGAALVPTDHPQIRAVNEPQVFPDNLDALMGELARCVEIGRREDAQHLLRDLVATIGGPNRRDPVTSEGPAARRLHPAD